MLFTSDTDFHQPNLLQENVSNFWRQEEGVAMLIALIALSIFSLLGLYVSLNATTEVRISDNFESHQRADTAARAGLNHARELFRGVEFNDVLRGADGVGTSTYPSTTSGKFAFRNWVNWSTARSLNILDPTSAVSALPDDGLFNTGKYNTTNGTILVPATGVALTAANSYGSGTVTTARYFLKVTDNDDGDNDPFTDKDGIIIVRSTGVAQTIRETDGGTVRANAVSVYESEFRRSKIFELGAPFVVMGDLVLPASSNMFNGNSFNIDGDKNPYGIATIDTNPSNLIHPASVIKGLLDPVKQYDQVKGQCCSPAIGDITASLTGDQLLLLDPSYLWNLAYNLLPSFADNVYQGNQSWTGSTAPDLGYFDPSKPANDPSQRMKITYINGDLSLTGNISGAGILVVTGALKVGGSLKWSGTGLVMGKGSFDMTGGSAAVDAGMLIVNLQAGNPPTFGTPRITLGGSSGFLVKESILRLVMQNLPLMEISRREVTSSMDP